MFAIEFFEHSRDRHCSSLCLFLSSVGKDRHVQNRQSTQSKDIARACSMFSNGDVEILQKFAKIIRIHFIFQPNGVHSNIIPNSKECNIKIKIKKIKIKNQKNKIQHVPER
jgi:hypothetical protein